MGAFVVAEGSTVGFLNYTTVLRMSMTNVGIRDVPDGGSELVSCELNIICIYTDRYCRVGGETTFTRCKVAGGSESSPGSGGALYVGEQGLVFLGLHSHLGGQTT